MDDIPPSEDRNLRFLRRLVTLLTVTMIVGVMTIVVLLVLRLQTPTRLPALPEEIALPDGVTPQAVTFGDGWIGVVTQDRRFLIFTPDGRALDEVALPGMEQVSR